MRQLLKEYVMKSVAVKGIEDVDPAGTIVLLPNAEIVLGISVPVSL
jgi:hypothetical protein